MTPEMRDLLKRMADAPAGRIALRSFHNSEKSRARALMDRGYALPDPAGWWTATDAGRKALTVGVLK